jgi:hypothetical protein
MYVEYMSNILQRKRIELEYFHRDTNKSRGIWNAGEDFQGRLRSELMEFEYYKLCDECMGLDDELPL